MKLRSNVYINLIYFYQLWQCSSRQWEIEWQYACVHAYGVIPVNSWGELDKGNGRTRTKIKTYEQANG